MLKNIMSGVFVFGLLVVSTSSNAEVLVNHHGHSFEEFEARQAAHHRASHHPVRHERPHHYRSYKQHSKVVIRCFSTKQGQRRRVC
ncbi:MAG: hypothetical protein KGO49_10420 [Gammaproteobacteria bacterium]|nr:hypothetical protein [Gammaproteobacteria bacterium]